MASYIKAKDMTLREYYAGQALNGLLSHMGCKPDVEIYEFNGKPISQQASEHLAKSARIYADALIKELGK